MPKREAEVVRREMLQRPVDQSRYRGVVRSDKTVRWAVDELRKVEQLRGRPSDSWPTTTALPGSLDQLADVLTELGWDDLASLARREELAAYRGLAADRPGAFSGEIAAALSALRGNLMTIERYEEALEVVDEQLRLSGTGRTDQGRDSEAPYWRTEILARLGRHGAAVEAAAMAVDEIRGRLKRPGDVSVDLGHALAAYADQLDAVGRVSEAADVTAEVVAYWREHSDSTAQFLFAVDRLGERLVRSGRTEEAGACITEAIRKVRRRKPQHELARIWHDFSVRLLSLDLPTNALEPGMKAVKLHRELAYWAREHHRKVETADDWDDDHRYTWAYLLQRRREELKSSHDDVRRAERNLREGLLTLSACLRRLDRLDEATAAEAEAAAVAESLARSSDYVPPDPDWA
ncbi:hypothetical protein [Streptomyces sp. NBC_01508]|uniref:hypothetical protein n=1 Tax=Streptomyces sp. NBC_01508 TaxID=2903888 RepID=UPI0038688CE4